METDLKKPRLLILSHVLPLLGEAGQQQRVYYTLMAMREFFHMTFVTSVDLRRADKTRKEILSFCDEVIILPAEYSRSRITKAWHRAASLLYSMLTGLKPSNYVIGRLEFAPSRMRPLLESSDFDLALFEYWHASDNVSLFHRKGIPCVLDMHNILWQSYARQLNAIKNLPGWWKRCSVARYKRKEERAWKEFDAIIAINTEEERYIRKSLSADIQVLYTPMGVDLRLWPYSWKPVRPTRIAYYGGLESTHNQEAALICHNRIMPEIWRRLPEAELWLVGSNPPELFQTLLSDSRVKVTGYVEDIQQLLGTMSVLVCPWSGTYGFRSRLIEAMALGVPVAASPDAVYGMEIDNKQSLSFGSDHQGLARACLDLIRDPEFASRQSRSARKQVEDKFGFDATYGELARRLLEFASQKRRDFR